MKIQWKNLITCISIPLAVGSLSALLTKNSMETFASVAKPALAPPGWLFPVVWTILYILMGIASYLVATSREGGPKDAAWVVYGLQLFFNFFWSIIFFDLGRYGLAFVWLVALWLLILKTTVPFYQISRPAGYLMLSYLLWVTFAGYLNFMIFLLN